MKLTFRCPRCYSTVQTDATPLIEGKFLCRYCGKWAYLPVIGKQQRLEVNETKSDGTTSPYLL